MQLRSSVGSPIDREVIKEVKIILTATNPYAMYELSNDYDDVTELFNPAAFDSIARTERKLSVSLDQWSAEVQITRDETFVKLEEVYGYMKALEIFKVLRG